MPKKVNCKRYDVIPVHMNFKLRYFTSQSQAPPSERATSPVEESEVVGATWGVSEPRSPGSSSAAMPLSATPSVAPPKYKPNGGYSNRPNGRPSVETSGSKFLNQEREDLTISELGVSPPVHVRILLQIDSRIPLQLSLVDLDIASARVEHAASVVDVEKAKKRSVEWELNRLRRRSETSGSSTPIQEHLEGLELQVKEFQIVMWIERFFDGEADIGAHRLFKVILKSPRRSLNWPKLEFVRKKRRELLLPRSWHRLEGKLNERAFYAEDPADHLTRR